MNGRSSNFAGLFSRSDASVNCVRVPYNGFGCAFPINPIPALPRLPLVPVFPPPLLLLFLLHSKGETVSDEINALHKKNKEEEEKKRKAAAAAAAASTSSSSVPKKVLTDFCDLRDDVVFGEVAMAPPTLTAKPRKAETKDNRNDNLLLTALVKNNNNNSNSNNNDDKTKLKKKPGKQGTLIKKAGKLKDLSALQKSNLLNERQRVVDKYRKLKSGNLGKL